MYDAIIVGGSYAGQAAALQLARARRRVLVVDAGKRRNRFASHSHGFLGRDGAPGADIAAEGKAQLLRYPTVSFVEGKALAAEAVEGGGGEFAVSLSSGARERARKLIIACGVTDTLPDIPGMTERWGKSVFICPYCDGYELGGGEIAVIATGAQSLHQALLLTEWGKVTFFTNATFAPDDGQRRQLAARGIVLDETRVEAIAGERADLVLADGRTLRFVGAFTAPKITLTSPIAADLGCAMTDGPMGSFIRIDQMAQTSVAGVFACGDATRGAGSVSIAVGEGAMAGGAAHRALVFPEMGH